MTEKMSLTVLTCHASSGALKLDIERPKSDFSKGQKSGDKKTPFNKLAYNL